MFFSPNITELRQAYLDAWKKSQQGSKLTPLEHQIVEVLQMHPEYHAWLSHKHLDTQFHPELHGSNPFLHLGLHLALKEQIQTNRPKGIQTAFTSYLKRHPHINQHDVEHLFMDVLALTLWEAQRLNIMPNELTYLEACQKL